MSRFSRIALGAFCTGIAALLGLSFIAGADPRATLAAKAARAGVSESQLFGVEVLEGADAHPELRNPHPDVPHSR